MGKEICAFANASGGKIILGVEDTGSLKGFSLSNSVRSKIQDCTRNIDPSFSIDISVIDDLVVLSIPEGDQKPYFVNGHCYLRIGSNSQQLKRDEIKEFFQSEGRVIFDEKFISYDFNNFSHEAFSNYLSRAKITANQHEKQLLENLGFYKDGLMNYSGVLFFSKNILEYLRNASIHCVLYQGSSKILDKKEFSSDLVSNYESAINYITTNIRTEYVIKKLVREEYVELPQEALREALINAIAHRDYFSNAPIIINIRQNSVEILNPTIMDSSITLADLIKGSYPKNLFLFSCLERINFVEKAGSGILRIKKSLKEYKLPNAKIQFSKRLFLVRFQRPSIENSYEKRFNLGINSQKTTVKTRVKTRVKIFHLIKENPSITIPEIAQRIDLTVKGVEWNITKLKEENKIKRVGSAKGGHWELVGET